MEINVRLETKVYEWVKANGGEKLLQEMAKKAYEAAQVEGALELATEEG